MLAKSTKFTSPSQTHKIYNATYLKFAEVIEKTFKWTVDHLVEVWPQIWNMTPKAASAFLLAEYAKQSKRERAHQEELERARRFR